MNIFPQAKQHREALKKKVDEAKKKRSLKKTTVANDLTPTLATTVEGTTKKVKLTVRKYKLELNCI